MNAIGWGDIFYLLLSIHHCWRPLVCVEWPHFLCIYIAPWGDHGGICWWYINEAFDQLQVLFWNVFEKENFLRSDVVFLSSVSDILLGIILIGTYRTPRSPTARITAPLHRGWSDNCRPSAIHWATSWTWAVVVELQMASQWRRRSPGQANRFINKKWFNISE